jgi:hypothetical protein
MRRKVVELQRDGDSDVAGKSVVQLIAKFIGLACQSFDSVMPKSIGGTKESCRYWMTSLSVAPFRKVFCATGKYIPKRL